MMRILNLIVIGALIASAIGVYSIKYQSTMQAEQVAKLRRQIDAEHATIATLKAEWAFLSQPQRLQSLADANTPLKPMVITQLVQMKDLPDRPPPQDAIGDKLKSLGLDPLADTKPVKPAAKVAAAKVSGAKIAITKISVTKIAVTKIAVTKIAGTKPAGASDE